MKYVVKPSGSTSAWKTKVFGAISGLSICPGLTNVGII